VASTYQLAASAEAATAPAEPPIKFDGYVDEVTEDGRVLGWASRPGHVARLEVGIFHNGTLLARAVTQGFRADLLAAGHGLGHCAFAARLQTPPAPGRCDLGLGLIGLPTVMKRYPIAVPPIRRPLANPAGTAARWTDEDVLHNLPRLHLAAQLEALGVARFVDGGYQFVLGRWAEAEAIEAVRRDLAAGSFHPDEWLRTLIESDERRSRASEKLPTPFEPRFPFTYPCAAPYA
jgi:hypothetical protein